MISAPIIVRIPGPAQGKARARAGPNGWFTPAKTKAAELAIANHIRATMRARPPIDGPVSVQINAIYRPPSSWSKKRQRAAIEARAPKITKPDVDNIAKLVLDALNGVAFVDDNRIVALQVSKVYGPEDMTTIEIREVST